MPASNIYSGRPDDPHGLGPVTESLSSGTKKRVKAAVVAATLSLMDGERAHAIVCGEYLGYDGVLVLTDRRVLAANSRTFAPDIDSVAIASLDDVKGWAESNRATLRVTGGGSALILGDIREVDGAQAFAKALRDRL